MTDRGPDVDDETQQEPPEPTHPPVAVTVEGPVRVQELPVVVAAVRRLVLPADNSIVQVANADLRRRVIKVLSTDQPFVMGVEKGHVEGSYAGLFPINVWAVMEAPVMLYAKSATGGTAATLTIIELDWTE